jgi:hypothetical protein
VRSLVLDLHVVLAHPDVLVSGYLPGVRDLWQGHWDWQGLQWDHVDLNYGFVEIQGLEVFLGLGWRDGAAELLQNARVHNDRPRLEVWELLPVITDLGLNNA